MLCLRFELDIRNKSKNTRYDSIVQSFNGISG